MNGCRLTKMAVEIVSLTHVVTTPDYDVFPHIQSCASAVIELNLTTKKYTQRFLGFYYLRRNNFF